MRIPAPTPLPTRCEPVTSPSVQRLVPWSLAALIALHLLHVLHYNFIADDTFISLRYAANLIAGHGLVYNLGERIEGFTNPLWTLLLAGFGYLGFDLLMTARALGVLFAGLALLAAFWLARQCGASPAAALVAPSLLACNGSFACWAAAGMETPLFAGLIATALAATLAGRYWPSAGLAAAAALTRPEGLLVPIVAGGYQIYRCRREGARPWAPWLLASLGPVVLLLAGRLWYYGDILPNTYYAKTGGGWAQMARGWEYLGDYAADHEGLLLLVAVAGWALWHRSAGLRLAAGAFLLLWLAVVWVGGDGLPMYRFALAPLPLFAALAASLIDELTSRIRPRLAAAPRSGIVAAARLAAAWIYTHASPPRLKSHYGSYQYQQQVEIPQWTRAGQWLASSAPPGASLATVPIGAVGYYSGLKVYDMLGLTDRHIARRQYPGLGQGWAGHEKGDGQYILKRRPTYLLLGNIDITTQPRDPRKRPFIPYDNPHIWTREQDLFTTDLIFEHYRPRSVQLIPGEYLNFYELKKEHRNRPRGE